VKIRDVARPAGPMDADVVIAGLGPTGLVLAHVLGMRGHRVVVLEREPVFYGNARAVYTDDECMRIFQSIDVANELQSKMLLETPVQFVRPDGSVMAQYVPLERPFGWPVVNFFYQPYLESTLAELLARYPNVEVRRGREVTDFVQTAGSVAVVHCATSEFRFGEATDAKVIRTGDSDPQTLRAKYLIGADGGRSVVRTKLGIEMSGKNFPEPWLVVDLQRKAAGDALRHRPYFSFVVDADLPTVCCIQPEGFHRFEFLMMPGQTKEELEHPDTVRSLISKWVDPDAFEVKRKLVYTFNALVANQWRDGRVFLAGDAAHMTPQFMGQGASSGVRDASNLGWKLDLVLRGLASDALLDTYESERRDHAKAMIDASVFLKDVVSMTNPVGTAVRDLVVKVALAIPGLSSWLRRGGFKPTPVYTNGRYFGRARRRRRGPEGALAPQPEVRRIDGRRVMLDDLLGGGFALIGYGVDPLENLSERTRATLARLNARAIALFPYGARPQGVRGAVPARTSDAMEVEDIGGSAIRWFEKSGFRRGATAILRPDRFAFAMVAGGELEAAVTDLESRLGRSMSSAEFAPAAMGRVGA